MINYLEHNIHVLFYEGLLIHSIEYLARLLNYLAVELDTSQRKELKQKISFAAYNATKCYL